jgi:thymidylate kinase (EC 2.7.4.9)
LTLLFDVDVAIASQRLAGNTSLDRFEQEQAAFFERVRRTICNAHNSIPRAFAFSTAHTAWNRFAPS